MNPALLAVLVVAAVTLLVLLCALAVAVSRGRRSTDQALAALAASRTDVDALRARLDLLEATREAAAPPVIADTEYVITSAGLPDASPPAVPDRVVLSTTFGEPLVKLVAFGYGVRRALSPASRNRIGFEMRREVKRARKQRRRDIKETRRALQAAERGRLSDEDAA